MPRSKDELRQAHAQSEAWLETVNPADVPEDAIDHRRDLRQIGTALISIEAAEQALEYAVVNARLNKRSWTEIANVLGISRQAARERFDDRVALAQASPPIARPAAVAPGRAGSAVAG